MALNATWLEFLWEQFPQGSKIKISELKEGPLQAESMPLGTLDRIDESGVFHVRLGDGSSLGLVLGEDRFSVLPTEPTTLKLHMADLECQSIILEQESQTQAVQSCQKLNM